jgi:hypothetical protein
MQLQDWGGVAVGLVIILIAFFFAGKMIMDKPEEI